MFLRVRADDFSTSHISRSNRYSEHMADLHFLQQSRTDLSTNIILIIRSFQQVINHDINSYNILIVPADVSLDFVRKHYSNELLHEWLN